MIRLEFTVLGDPQPQGSKTVAKGQGRSWVREDNRRLEPWRDSVAAAALRAMDGREPLAGALELRATFVFRRPKGHYGTGRNANRLKPSAPTFQTSRPDTDKLVRAIGDAVTGIVCRDDAAFAIVHAEKHYGQPAYAFLVIEQIPEEVMPY